MIRREKGKVIRDDPAFEQLQNMLSVGPTTELGHGPLRIEAPTFDDDGSDDGMSDTTNVKPMGIEEFKQRIENSKAQTKKEGKTKKK